MAAQAGAKRNVIRAEHALQPFKPGDIQPVARAQCIPDTAVIHGQEFINGRVKLVSNAVERVSGLHDVDRQLRGLRFYAGRGQSRANHW